MRGMRAHYRQNGYPNRMRVQQSNGKSTGNCPSAVEYIGNVFLLGLATLVGELVDLQAANALSVLLEPFQNENAGGTEQDILANTVADTDVVDLLEGLI